MGQSGRECRVAEVQVGRLSQSVWMMVVVVVVRTMEIVVVVSTIAMTMKSLEVALN